MTIKNIFLIVMLVLIWGLSWPMVTIGLPYCSPLWYNAICLVIATVFVLLAVGVSGHLIFPQKKDVPFLVSIGVLQVGLFTMLMTLGLAYVPPGRSALIAYLAPFFNVPLAVLFFRETLSSLKIIGLMLGTLGVIGLFNPWALNWHDAAVLKGYGFLLGAAFVWAIGILHIRYTECDAPVHVLLPWHLLIGAVLNTAVAFFYKGLPTVIFSKIFMISMGYSALLSSTIAYWIMISLNRSLPVVEFSLILLLVPVSGLLFSAFMVGEVISRGMLIAVGFILSGLACCICTK